MRISHFIPSSYLVTLGFVTRNFLDNGMGSIYHHEPSWGGCCLLRDNSRGTRLDTDFRLSGQT